MKTEPKVNKEVAQENKSNFKKLELSFWKRVGIFVGLLIAAFLLGLVPMWLSELKTEQQRDAAQANLKVSQIQNRLATASIKVSHGEYEEARLATSDFFTDLRTEIDSKESVFNAEQRESLRGIIAQRDELITLLARNDPSTGDRLATLYLAYLQIITPQKQTAKL